MLCSGYHGLVDQAIVQSLPVCLDVRVQVRIRNLMTIGSLLHLALAKFVSFDEGFKLLSYDLTDIDCAPFNKLFCVRNRKFIACCEDLIKLIHIISEVRTLVAMQVPVCPNAEVIP